MNSWRTRGVLIVLVVIIADQLSKWWVVTQLFGDKSIGFFQWLVQKSDQAAYAVHEITSFLNIVMVWNPGVSFGFLQNAQQVAAHGLTVFAMLVSLGFLVWLWREPGKLRAWAIGLVVGGALGNVWDRLRFDAVADFIDVHVAGYHWPAFNVADSAICIGVALLLFETFFSKSPENA